MMDHCPHCGAELEARLAAAIRDPKQEESCPRKPGDPSTPEQKPRAANRLTGLMLLGHLAA